MLDTLDAFQFQVGISPCSSLNFIAMLNGCLPTSVTFKYLGHKNSVIDLRSQFTYNSITPIKTLGRFSVTSLWSSQRPRGPAWVLHRARLRAPARVSQAQRGPAPCRAPEPARWALLHPTLLRLLFQVSEQLGGRRGLLPGRTTAPLRQPPPASARGRGAPPTVPLHAGQVSIPQSSPGGFTSLGDIFGGVLILFLLTQCFT